MNCKLMKNNLHFHFLLPESFSFNEKTEVFESKIFILFSEKNCMLKILYGC